jgi:hypothetical protein
MILDIICETAVFGGVNESVLGAFGTFAVLFDVHHEGIAHGGAVHLNGAGYDGLCRKDTERKLMRMWRHTLVKTKT